MEEVGNCRQSWVKQVHRKILLLLSIWQDAGNRDFRSTHLLMLYHLYLSSTRRYLISFCFSASWTKCGQSKQQIRIFILRTSWYRLGLSQRWRRFWMRWPIRRCVGSSWLEHFIHWLYWVWRHELWLYVLALILNCRRGHSKSQRRWHSVVFYIFYQ